MSLWSSNSARRGRDGESGSALVYILIAIALLAALTISFMEPSSQQTTSQNTFRAVSEMSTQVDFIRSSIQECVLAHPKGDGAAITAGAQKNQPYPIMPDDTYLDGCVAAPAAAAGDNFVSFLRCPGNPGEDACHTLIFGGASSKFLPPPPPLFQSWRYYAGDDGVFFWTETNKTDPYIDTVLEKLDDSFSECEADIVDTSAAPAGAKDLDSAGALVCGAGSKCFRVWMIVKAPSVYNGDAAGDEAACP